MRRRARDLRRVPQLQNSQLSSIKKPESILVDLRSAASFVRGFIPGSYSLPLAMDAGLLRQNVPPAERKLYLIGECDHRQKLMRNFAKHGFEIAGWFQQDVLREWQMGGGRLATIEELVPEALAVRIAAWKTIVVDFRDSEAFRCAHIPEALNFSLKDFKSSVAGLPHESDLTAVCETGEQSSFAASLLWNMNYRNVAILRGGFRRYLEAGLRVAHS